jgi:hypothetical protein
MYTTLSYFINVLKQQGWILASIAYANCYVMKNDKIYRILIKDLHIYINNGWLHYTDNVQKYTITIHNNVTCRRVCHNELDQYLADGWLLGSYAKTQSTVNTKVMIKDNMPMKYVKEQDFDEYLANGYKFKQSHMNALYIK